MTGKGSGAHLPGLGEEGWVWGRSVCGQKVQTSGFLHSVQGGAFGEANRLQEENSGCFYFPPDETDGKKKNPTSRVTHDGKQQRSKKAFLLYTGSSTDK